MEQTTSSAKVNLFASAKSKEPKKAAKKEKRAVRVEGIAQKIEDYYTLSEQLESVTTKLEVIKSDLKDLGRQHLIEIVKKDKVYPGSFKLVDKLTRKEVDEDGNVKEVPVGDREVMFLPTDKYLTVTEEKKNLLTNMKQTELLDEKTVYTLNPELIGKEGVAEALSEAIMNCEALSEDDKGKLLMATTVYSVKKGTIKELHTFENPGEVFDLIQPVCQLKNAGGDKDEE